MKKVLMFGFDALPEILTVAGIVKQFGGEAAAVSRESCGLTPGGKLLVFCGLERELDELLAALRGTGIVCMKAVLTAANRDWTPGRLYRELERERRAMGG